MLQWLLAALHLPALGIGLGAVALRAAALGGPLDRDGLRRDGLRRDGLADTAWGGAALLWLVTGLRRAFGGVRRARTTTSTAACGGLTPRLCRQKPVQTGWDCTL